VTPAFLVELTFYLASGFADVRAAFDRLGSKPLRAELLAISAVIPYLIETTFTGAFELRFFVALLSVVLVAAFWYVWIDAGILSDLAFLAFMGAVYLSKSFDHGYGHPAPHVALGILGQLMWIRLGLMAVLSLRGMADVRFSFVPLASEWRVGVQFYAYFIPVAVALGYLLNFARYRPQQLDWWKFLLLLIGMFFAFLWVVALAEEFFFRAFLQTVLAKRLGSNWLGLALASILFGLAHLWFRSFPNWRFAIVGGTAGVFYGLAFQKARSIRASMVTHALVVTTWRMFFVS